VKAFRYTGKPISKNGAYVDASIDEYHAGTLCDGLSISASGLSVVIDSPAHFWDTCAWNVEAEPEDGEKEEYVFGRAAHTYAFERDQFNKRFVVIPKDAPKKPTSAQIKAKKPSDETIKQIEWWDEFKAQINGRHLIKPDEFYDIEKMSKVLANDEWARAAFGEEGAAELTLAYKDEVTGIWVLSRPDWLSRRIVDYKTAACAQPELWSRRSFDRYVIQAAISSIALLKATGERRDEVFHVIQEKKRPYVVQVARWTPEHLQFGAVKVRNALDRLARCRDSGVWPAYRGEPFDVIPPYEVRKLLELQA